MGNLPLDKARQRQREKVKIKENAHKNVLKFDVSMYKALCVQVADSFNDVKCHPQPAVMHTYRYV